MVSFYRQVAAAMLEQHRDKAPDCRAIVADEIHHAEQCQVCGSTGGANIDGAGRYTCGDCGFRLFGARKLSNQERGRVLQEVHNLLYNEVRAEVLQELQLWAPGLRWTVKASHDGQWWEAWGRRGRRTPWLYSIGYSPASVRHGHKAHPYWVHVPGIYAPATYASVRSCMVEGICSEVLKNCDVCEELRL
jgi:hypothetical protein